MPRLNKGGKFVFGLSVIHENRSVQIPPQAINEYRLSNENKIIIFTGSKITGGFCVTSYPLLSSSKLSHILKECPTLNDSSIFPGTLIPYKGRSYLSQSITSITYLISFEQYAILSITTS